MAPVTQLLRGNENGPNVELSWVRVWCEQPSVVTQRETGRIHGGTQGRCYNPRHAELTVKSLNLDSVKGVTTPSAKKRLEEVLALSPQLDALQTRHYRSVVMLAAYLSQDRPALSYSTKELARDTQKPTEQSMTNLKRLGRYLEKRPRLVHEQTAIASVVRLDVHGDPFRVSQNARRVWC